MARKLYKTEQCKYDGLFPISIELNNVIPSTHPVRIINQIVDKLNLKDLISTYKGGGTTSYNPRTLVKIIVYSYLCNIYSGRRMEKQLEENIHFMWLSGMTKPDFRTLNRFRSKRLGSQIDTIFTQIVELLHEEGLVTLDVQYIDGTKLESVANKYTFVWRKNIDRYDAHFRSKIDVVLKQAKEVVQSENELEERDVQNMTSQELEDKLNSISSKLEEMDNAPKELIKSVDNAKNKTLAKVKEYEIKREIIGDRNSYSTSDTGATFMRMKEDHMGNGQLKPAYNTQIATENQYIINYMMSQNPGDTVTLIPFLDSFENRFGFQSAKVVADSGYGSEMNYEYIEDKGIDNFVKFPYFHKEQKRNYKNNPYYKDNLYYNKEEDYFVCPMGQHMKRISTTTSESTLGYISELALYRAERCNGCPMKSSCTKSSKERTISVNHNLERHKEIVRTNLKCFEGLYHRSKRPIEPEAVFGQIKFNSRFNRFSLKGIYGTTVEFGLVAIAHNLRKMIKSREIA